MKRYKWVIYLLLSILIVGALAFWWFWSLGSIAQTADPQMHLAIVRGSVFVQAKGQGDEQPAQNGMALSAGDVIRTDAGAAANIVVPGRAEVRLDEQTALNLEQTEPSWSQRFVLRWQVESGRAWTRVMRLLDLDSAVSGQTNNVVATVRGTAFAISRQDAESEVYVDHAGVVVAHETEEPAFLTSGDWLRAGPDGGILDSGSAASNTWKSADWIAANQSADRAFDLQAAEALIGSYKDPTGTAPDQWAFTLAQWSEKLHLKMAGERCSVRFASYIGRHLGYVQDLIMRGKSGLAYHHLTWIEQEIQMRRESGSCADIEPMRDAIGRVLLSVTDETPEDPVYRLKLRIEDLYASLWDPDSAQAIYARGLSVDARLDEAERYDCMPEVREPFEKAIEAARLAVTRQETDVQKSQERFDANERSGLLEKLHIQRQRYRRLVERLEQCTIPVVPETSAIETATSTTSTNLGETATTTRLETDYSTGSQPVKPKETVAVPQPKPVEPVTAETPVVPPPQEPTPQPEPEPEPQTTALNLTRIQMFIQPNPIYVNQSAKLFVQGYRSDGSTVDVTASATFQKIGNIGTLSGATFTSNQSGSVTIIANVTDGGNALSSQVSLQIIQQPLSLEQISVSISGGLPVYQGESRTISVTASYSDGSTKDVTSASKLTLSNYNNGEIIGRTFVSNPNSFGNEVIYASYSELGMTQSGSYSFIIQQQ